MSDANGTTTHDETPAGKGRGPGLAKGKEIIDILLSHIHEPEDFNVRQQYDEDAIERLGASIESQGLNEPLPVVAHPAKEGHYLLAGAFTRYRALKARGLRGTVPCIVHRFKQPWGAAVLNMTGNTSVTALHPADLAKRLYELEAGTYPTLDGSAPVPLERKAICEAVGLGTSYVGNLIRAWKRLAEPIRVEWAARRGKDAITTDEVIGWAKLKEAGQIEAFEGWLAEQEARKKRKEAGEKGKQGKKRGGKDDETKAVPVTRGELRKKLDAFRDKIENGPALKGHELARAEAKVEALRWAAGELTRLGLT